MANPKAKPFSWQWEHGKMGTYTNHGCRCDPCRLAYNHAAKMRKRRKKLEFDPSDPSVVHGKAISYERGCRCEECRSSAATAHRQRTYGIGDLQLASMKEAQQNACAICGTVRSLFIDHDHQTGKVRGLLCMPCNVGLGKMGDDMAGLQRAMEYLLRASLL